MRWTAPRRSVAGRLMPDRVDPERPRRYGLPARIYGSPALSGLAGGPGRPSGPLRSGV
jgi:hypothetical protein